MRRTSCSLRCWRSVRRPAALPPRLVERNIDDDEELQRRFALTIPVVAVGDRELELATSAAKLRRFLAEALDGAPST